MFKYSNISGEKIIDYGKKILDKSNKVYLCQEEHFLSCLFVVSVEESEMVRQTNFKIK